ncbi:hypothetical protein VINI7043_11101 [Vibrio nigripulchritudo ATCC 27043]|uniref:endonuclease/exonuclease/phosphatase family protein n=1 Tax=Vibrio nigripulchritudo TaxID=28173 RepID=UPI00021C3106|nr:endonuclease/exonuclease/phosphatase family protein [Vibrio nigripulchritudo]EGU60302.1 hypothetical protein VINI7043_11101 [Vibrio nigripulchritudo ATCC 27043]
MTSSFTVATFNLFNFIEPPSAFYEFDNIYSRDEWQRKCDWTEKVLRETCADLIGFQEVFSAEALAHLCKRQGYSHFKTVDTPAVESDYVYFSPVTGLASKFPIHSCSGLRMDKHIQKALGFESSIRYSRMPLHATVRHPKLDLIDVVVVHLKSQRPMDVENEGTQYSRYTNDYIGSVLSSQQRNDEAMALRYQLRQIKALNKRPMILMGDMNQNIGSPSVQCLIEPQQNFTDRGSQKLYLSDSWQIAKLDTPRQPSHYHGESGNVLDYILLSQEFSSAKIQHKTLDKHLVQPEYDEDSMSSDHGIVVALIEI